MSGLDWRHAGEAVAKGSQEQQTPPASGAGATPPAARAAANGGAPHSWRAAIRGSETREPDGTNAGAASCRSEARYLKGSKRAGIEGGTSAGAATCRSETRRSETCYGKSGSQAGTGGGTRAGSEGGRPGRAPDDRPH